MTLAYASTHFCWGKQNVKFDKFEELTKTKLCDVSCAHGLNRIKTLKRNNLPSKSNDATTHNYILLAMFISNGGGCLYKEKQNKQPWK